MGVGAASSEGIDGSAPCLAGRSWPIEHRQRYLEAVRSNLLIWLLQVHLGRNLASFKTLYGLDYTSQPCASLKMPNATFERANHQGSISTRVTKHGIDCGQFQPISTSCSSALSWCVVRY